MVTDMANGKCRYQVWTDEGRKLTYCGEEGLHMVLPKNPRIPASMRATCLCPTHLEFVKDCMDYSEIEIAKEQKKTERETKKKAKANGQA
jgi:hypothetical protein